MPIWVAKAIGRKDVCNGMGYGVPERQAFNARIRLIELLKTADE